MKYYVTYSKTGRKPQTDSFNDLGEARRAIADLREAGYSAYLDTPVINTPQDFNRAAESLFLGDRMRRQATDFDVYSVRNLKHATVVDPVKAPVVTNNNPPNFDGALNVYTERVAPKHRFTHKAPVPAFKPFSHKEGLKWEIRDFVTRCCLFVVQGPHIHAYREAERYCRHYGIVPKPHGVFVLHRVG